MVLTGKVTNISIHLSGKKRTTIDFTEGGYIVLLLDRFSPELGTEVSVELTITQQKKEK